MNIRKSLMMSVAVVAIAGFSLPATATSTTTQTVTQKTSTVNPDGSVSYESQSVTVKDPAPVETTTTTVVTTPTTSTIVATPTTVVTSVPVTFYYYDPVTTNIVSVDDFSDSIFDLWDDDHNDVIDMQEFYRNKMVMYEPVEYSKRTYQDIDADGLPELTQEEYTVRLQQLPLYSTLNRDSKAGISLYEFIGTGFQAADENDNNYLDIQELRHAFYGQTILTKGTGNYN